MSFITDFMISHYNNEKAQDAVNEMIDNNASYGDILFSYDDNIPKLSGRIRKSIQNKGSVSGSQTFDLSLYGTITLTLNNDSSFDLTGSYINNKLYVTEILIENAGGYTITWDSKFRFKSGTPPVLTETGIDSLTFVTRDGGITCYVFVNSLDLKAVV